jgi:hypothetical protein
MLFDSFSSCCGCVLYPRGMANASGELVQAMRCSVLVSIVCAETDRNLPRPRGAHLTWLQMSPDRRSEKCSTRQMIKNESTIKSGSGRGFVLEYRKTSKKGPSTAFCDVVNYITFSSSKCALPSLRHRNASPSIIPCTYTSLG